MSTTPRNPSPHPSEAPLANDDVLEQDGSEDPGSGLEQVHDALEPPGSAGHVDLKRGDAVRVPPPEADSHIKSSR